MKILTIHFIVLMFSLSTFLSCEKDNLKEIATEVNSELQLRVESDSNDESITDGCTRFHDAYEYLTTLYAKECETEKDCEYLDYLISYHNLNILIYMADCYPETYCATCTNLDNDSYFVGIADFYHQSIQSSLDYLARQCDFYCNEDGTVKFIVEDELDGFNPKP